MKSLLLQAEKGISVVQSEQYDGKGLFFSSFIFLMINFCTFNMNPSITKVTLDIFIITFNFKSAYPAWVMFYHIELLETFVVKVSSLVRMKIKKNYRLVKKGRQKHIRALSHLCLLRIFFSNLCLHFFCWYLFLVRDPFVVNVPIRYTPKTPENHMFSVASRGHKLVTSSAKWDHEWPKYDQCPHYAPPTKPEKTKGSPEILGGHKTERSARKESSNKNKTIEDLLQAKK